MANQALRFRIAEFDTVVAGLDYAARGPAGCTFFSSRGETDAALSYAEIRAEALTLAHRLSAQRLERLARVAIVGETGPDFLVAFFACQYAGLLPVPLPISMNFGGHDAYVARLRAMMQAAGASLAIGPDEFMPALTEAAAPLAVAVVATVADLQNLSAVGADPRPLGPDEPCYVQYSSGSTRHPRGVLITQRSITHNARAIGAHGLALRPDDCGSSWLPLYHDMGLVGFCLTPMLSQIPIHYLSPTTFARRPLVWLKVLSERGGTISFSPTAGYELCLRAANGSGHRLDLRHWRVAGVGGDMIRPEVLDRFAERFAAHGFDPSAFVPSYGLAESTLAVSFGPLDLGMRRDVVELDALGSTGYAAPAREAADRSSGKVRSFAVCGRAFPGHDIAIRDEDGNVLPDRRIGRVWIRGPSLMGGYFDDPATLTAPRDPERWFDTGDLGYTLDGDLVIAGRSKDLIIWNGRNIWPQDLEWAVGELEGIRSGAVAAFAIDGAEGAEEIVIVAECRSMDQGAWSGLRRAVTTTLHRTAGVACRLVLTAPRSLPYTSSGKLSRAATKARYLEGAIRDVDHAVSAA